ncbi:MAG: DUF2752 domain-containing protein [Clostridiales bacterium]|nr:DUF2752 domain-containing protein [Clostridiales bacterium]
MKKRLIKSSLFSLPLIGFAAFYAVLWDATGSGLPCVWHLLTGWYCPSCGTGRMFMSLLRLDLYQAFRYNPFIFIMLPFLFAMFLRYEIAYLKAKNIPFSRIEYIFLAVFVTALILFGILRNIPQFSFLAPTTV